MTFESFRLSKTAQEGPTTSARDPPDVQEGPVTAEGSHTIAHEGRKTAQENLKGTPQ